MWEILSPYFAAKSKNSSSSIFWKSASLMWSCMRISFLAWQIFAIRSEKCSAIFSVLAFCSDWTEACNSGFCKIRERLISGNDVDFCTLSKYFRWELRPSSDQLRLEKGKSLERNFRDYQSLHRRRIFHFRPYSSQHR